MGNEEKLSDSELWNRLMTIPRPWKEVDFPRKDPTGRVVGTLKIWPLSQSEHMQAAARAKEVADKLIRNQRKDDPQLGYTNVYNNAAAVEILHFACRDATDVNRPAFPSPALMRDKLSADEIAILMALFHQVEDEVGPIIARMTKDEEDSFIRRLAEGGSVFPISSLSLEQRDRLLLSLACRVYSSLTDTPSAGSPPDESATESPSNPPQANEPEADVTLTEAEARALDGA